MHDHLVKPFIYGTIWGILSAVTAVEYGYIFTPRYVIPGSDYVVTVDLTHFVEVNGGTYDLTVNLKDKFSPVIGQEAAVSENNPTADITLKIPENISQSFSYRIVTVVSGKDGFLAKDESLVSYFSGAKDTVLIQTDKGLYKAGQTVQFRIMSVNNKRIVEVKTMTIEVFDGDNNRVRRWANVSDNTGVFVGKMEMSQYPVLGTWSIRVTSGPIVKTQSFKVMEFELPKFDVTLELPEVVSESDKFLEGKIKSMYTFGKGVTGSADLVLSLSSNQTKRFSKVYKLSDGEAAVKIALADINDALDSMTEPRVLNALSSSSTSSTTSRSSTFFRSPKNLKNRRRTVMATATVTEDNTGNTRKASVTIDFVKYNIGFKIDRSKGLYYIPGMSTEIVGRITNILGSTYDGLASDGFSVTIVVTYRQRTSHRQMTLVAETEMDIDNKNQFTYRIDGNLITDQMYSLKAEIRLFVKGTTDDYIRRELLYISEIRSFNGYFLTVEQLSGSKSLNVGESASYRISMTGKGELTTTYKVTSKGVVVKSGPQFTLSEDKPYDFNLTSTSEMVPSLVVLAWSILPLDKLSYGTYNYAVAGSIETKVKEPQIQETSIKFEKDSVQPGDNARLYLKSKSRSTFYILAIDKSVLLLDKGNDITEALLPDLHVNPVKYVQSSSTYSVLSYAGYRVGYFEIGNSFNIEHFTSTATVFSSLSVVSSSTKRKAVLPTETATRAPKESPKKEETIRKKFPDTWLFMNVTADVSGSASIVHKVPDTITSWVANCFAIGPQFRISTAVQKAELRVFMPFFISLQLPFSVIRNEQLVLQANIFNYHKDDLYVIVTLKKSSSFRGLAVVKRGKRRILEERCGNIVMCVFAKTGRATAVFFPIVPTEIGKIKITITADSSKFKDTVIKNLRVESEGAPRDVAYPILIDLSQETTFDTQMDLNYPSNTVEGSQRMRISLIGDVMGPTIDGLDRLVRMPYGCGEQNMITTAPSVFVYKYLKAVGKLTEQLKVKAENYIRTGMQRQLRYRHPDWSFSAWGGSGSGSTWLTAFVLKVFALGSHYVDIDDKIVTSTSSWLISIQNSDGSFPEKGNVIHRAMQGGSTGTSERITAYVLIALKEGRRASSNVKFCNGCLKRLENAIKKASNFLANNLDNQTSVYTVAISAYALTITDHSGAQRARNMLDGLSKGGTGQQYWEEPNQPPVTRFHYGKSTLATSIEMTAYGLLAFVESGTTVKAMLIQKWLIAQRNPYGGFISTQDTVLGLQALSELAATLRTDQDMTIMLSYRDVSLRKKKFRLTKSNAMIMQMADISTDTSSISIHAWGTKGSLAIFTVSLFYNINMDLEARSLNLNVTVLKETINGFTVRSCVSWLENEVSGMIVVEVGIPSGFEANRWGISEHKLLKITEIEGKSVILYYDQVTFSEICTDILVSRDKMVAKIKPVPCKAYEYYEPSNQVTVFYEPLSAKNSNICNICGIECGCESTGEKLWFPLNWCKKKMNN